MNPETALQTILMARSSADLQPSVEQVLANPAYYYIAHELARNCLATLCMHPLLTPEQAQGVLDACTEAGFFLAKNATLILELSTNPAYLNERGRALLQRLRTECTSTSPSMDGAIVSQKGSTRTWSGWMS